MSDDPVRTVVLTETGDLAFQEYFVRLKCEPPVRGFRFEGCDAARPTPGVIESIREASAVVLCPSNPWVSIDPILAVPGIRAALASRPAVAVSPIIGGETVKGPAAKMFRELGLEPSPLAVARHYGDLLDGLVLDTRDIGFEGPIVRLSLKTCVVDTLMSSLTDRVRLAQDVLHFVGSLL
jgi:LPPG:FO 2-phospho-L-lactate transferase